MAWRIKDKDNYYAIRWSSTEAGPAIFKISNGTRSNLGSGSVMITAGSWHRVKMVQAGNSITVYLDGTQVVTRTDATFTTAGGVGVFQRGEVSIGSWDNFSVTADNLSVIPRDMRVVWAANGEYRTFVADLQGRIFPLKAAHQATRPYLLITAGNGNANARLMLSTGRDRGAGR